ncbi:MAG: hypothetical protein ACRC33_23665, partial [Gemmataceae bacterium]
HLRTPPLVALAMALVFAFQPYHFERGQGHVMLSAYWHVPLLLFGAVWLLDPARMRPRLACGLAFAGAFGGHYYACYACLAYLVAGAYRSAVDRSARPARTAALLVGCVAAGFAANLAPNLLYWARHGGNRAVSVKPREYLEPYGLKLTPMLLPAAGHPLKPLRDFRRGFDAASALPGEGQPAIGLLASVGLVGLLGLAAFGRRDADATLTGLGVVAAVGLSAATVGGFGMLFGHLVTAQLHAHNRAGIVFALLGLAAAGAGLAAAGRWLDRPRVSGVLVALAGGLGLADVVPYTNPLPPAVTNVQFAAKERVARDIQAALPPGSAVYHLPCGNFPFDEYEYVKLFLFCDGLRWSSPSMQFRRAAALHADLEGGTADEFFERLALHGFDGLVIDRAAKRPGPMVARASDVLKGETPAAAGDGLEFYDLRARNAAERARHTPASWEEARRLSALAAGVRWPREVTAAGGERWASAKTVVLTLTNFGREPLDADLNVRLAGRGGFVVSGGAVVGGPREVGAEDAAVRLRLPPGRTLLEVGARGDEPARGKAQWFRFDRCTLRAVPGAGG